MDESPIRSIVTSWVPWIVGLALAAVSAHYALDRRISTVEQRAVTDAEFRQAMKDHMEKPHKLAVSWSEFSSEMSSIRTRYQDEIVKVMAQMSTELRHMAEAIARLERIQLDLTVELRRYRDEQIENTVARKAMEADRANNKAHSR